MTMAGFLGAVLALLLAPGPTNTLMALAGAQRGAAGMLRLIPAELCAYLAVVVPLSVLGADLLAGLPTLATALKLVAGIWVMWLALRLWQRPHGARAPRHVSARQVAVTTLLNPKALVVGLVLVPALPEGAAPAGLAAFAASVALVAALWGGLGALGGGAAGGRLPLLQRAASLWLGAVSVSILAGVLTA